MIMKKLLENLANLVKVKTIVTLVVVFTAMLKASWILTIVTMFTVAGIMAVTMTVVGKAGKYFIGQQKSLGAVNGYIEEMMDGQKVVKVFTHEEESLKEFTELNNQLFHSADHANRYGNFLGPINAQLGNVSYVLCALVGGALALGNVGGFTLGSLASFLTFNKSFNMPINQISQQLNNIVMALAGCERIFSLLDETPETDEGYVTLVNAKEVDGKLKNGTVFGMATKNMKH